MINSKKFMRIISFMMGLLILILTFSAILKKGGNVYDAAAVENKINEIVKEKADSMDVLFLGDSECYSSFSPLLMWSEHGYTSFVCATSAQRLCDTYAILRNAFKTQSPKLVVLETNCIYRNQEQVNNGDKVMNYLVKKVPVFKNHSKWKHFSLKLINNRDVKKNGNQKGFKLRTAVKPYMGGEYMHKTDEVKDIPELSKKYLDKITELCKQNGAELILVSSLSPKNWNYEKHNGVEKWAAVHNIDYLDMNLVNNSIGIDWTRDTKDGGDHLNYEGAKKVTYYIGDYFKENYFLEDHREESDNFTWKNADK